MRQIAHVLVFAGLVAGLVPQALPQQPGASSTSVKATFLADLNDLEKKLVSLAEATPQDKFRWRPGDGVRSTSEAYIHVAQSNYFFLAPMGVKGPANLGGSAEKTITDKAKVIDAVKASIAAARQTVTKFSEADLRKPIDLEGQKTSYEGALLIIAGHMHEHLGQLIAYARMSGVKPPWS